MAEQNRLILWGWFSSEIVKNKLIPDIEKNIMQYGVSFPIAYEAFQKNKYAVNGLYVHHSYAECDIPIGQKYTKIALMENYEIMPNSIQACHSEVLCFLPAILKCSLLNMQCEDITRAASYNLNK